jgi:hypothetical protein
MPKTFIKITNEDIYKELKEIKKHVMITNGAIKSHHKWLIGLSTGLTMVMGWLWGIK